MDDCRYLCTVDYVLYVGSNLATYNSSQAVKSNLLDTCRFKRIFAATNQFNFVHAPDCLTHCRKCKASCLHQHSTHPYANLSDAVMPHSVDWRLHWLLTPRVSSDCCTGKPNSDRQRKYQALTFLTPCSCLPLVSVGRPCSKVLSLRSAGCGAFFPSLCRWMCLTLSERIPLCQSFFL